MAKFVATGIDELNAALKHAGGLDEETIEKMLFAAGDEIVDELQKATRSSGFRTQEYAQHIRYAKNVKRDKTDSPYITISVNGKNAHGTRRAMVLFILNYGRREKPGQIHGTFFWTRGTKSAESRAQKKIEEIQNQKLKERGLI